MSDLVLENYANANLIWRDGAVDGSRRLRERHRAVRLEAARGRHPADSDRDHDRVPDGRRERAGVRGSSRGRAGSSVAKWQALAVRSRSRRAEARARLVLGLGAARRALERPGQDLRSVRLALGSRREPVRRAGASSDASSTPTTQTGQLNLPAGTRCVYGSTPLTASSVAALAKVTHDRELALTTPCRARDRAGTRARVARRRRSRSRGASSRTRFGGSTSAYRAALGDAGASLTVARGIIGDELRARDIVGSARAVAVSSGDVARFRATFAPVRRARARRVPGAELASRRARSRARDVRSRMPCSACGRGAGRRSAPSKERSRSRPATTRPPSRRCPTPSPGPRSSGSSAPSAARMRTRRGRSACRRLGREQARMRARPTARARRRRHLVVRAVPLAERARGGELGCVSARLGAARRRRAPAASRPSRPCRDPSSSRARARRPRER